ncbi:hypothetical protein SCALM49S_08651 [Streptomyces californicus]
MVFRNTMLQAAVPDELRGRLQGVFIVVVAGGPRLGDFLAGSVADLASPAVAVTGGGVLGADVARTEVAVRRERRGGGVGTVEAAGEQVRAPGPAISPIAPGASSTVPSSSTRRSRTPASGGPTVPGREAPSARMPVFIRVSVIPYRSITRRPVAAAMRSWSCTGSAADPETSSRAPANARASASRSAASPDPSSTSASRWYIVGTPNSMVPPDASSRATPSGENFPRWRTDPPRRSGPRTPRIRPCTWNNGSAWTRTSSPVHPQASSSASREAATARRGRTAPFGGPVVPEV